MNTMNEYYLVMFPLSLGILLFAIMYGLNYAGEISQPVFAGYYCEDKLGGEWVDTFGPNSCLVCKENKCTYLSPKNFKGQLKWVEKT